MAKIPPIQRISTEDFQEQASWIEKLTAPINQYFERTTSALNRSLTLNDNLAAEVRTVDVNGIYPLKLSWTLSARPVAVLVGGVARTSGQAVVQTTAVQVLWSFNQSGQLQIDGLVGALSPVPSDAAKYRLTLVCLTG